MPLLDSYQVHYDMFIDADIGFFLRNISNFYFYVCIFHNLFSALLSLRTPIEILELCNVIK